MRNCKDMSDRWLLARAAEKDEEAFELLYRLYYPRVIQFVSRTVNDPCLVEEIAADALFAVWVRAATFEGRARVSTWIMSIAYRQALKALDRAYVRREVPVEPIILDTPSVSGLATDPLGHFLIGDSVDKIKLALAGLGRDHREVLELVALGHSAAEIAQIVNCPCATVRSRLFYARQKVRALLEDAADAQKIGNGCQNFSGEHAHGEV